MEFHKIFLFIKSGQKKTPTKVRAKSGFVYAMTTSFLPLSSVAAFCNWMELSIQHFCHSLSERLLNAIFRFGELPKMRFTWILENWLYFCCQLWPVGAGKFYAAIPTLRS